MERRGRGGGHRGATRTHRGEKRGAARVRSGIRLGRDDMAGTGGYTRAYSAVPANDDAGDGGGCSALYALGPRTRGAHGRWISRATRRLAQAQVRRPWLFVAMGALLATLLGSWAACERTQLLTALETFLPRGTRIADADHVAMVLRDDPSGAGLTRLAPPAKDVYAPEGELALRARALLDAESAGDAGRYDPGSHPFYVLFETVDPSDDIFSPENARVVCEAKRAVEAVTTRRAACLQSAIAPGYGPPPDRLARSCWGGASVMTLSTFVDVQMRHLIGLASNPKVSRALAGPVKLACRAAAAMGTPLTPPCGSRLSLGCDDVDACDAPCLVHGLDVCEFLIEADPRVAELQALSGLLQPPADANGCGAGELNTTSLSLSLAGLGATIAFSGRATAPSMTRVLPHEGGRMLVSREAALAAAAGDTAGCPPRSSVTRLAYDLRNVPAALEYAEEAGAAALAAVRVYGEGRVRASWRDYPAFEHEADTSLLQDALWCVGSVIFVCCYMIWHTQSAIIAAGGIACVAASFPVCAWVYRVVLDIEWMGAFNFIALFLVIGIGADDIFVVVDYWRQARAGRCSRTGVTTDRTLRLAWALEHAAVSMACTSATTAVAFATNFGSPIPPARLFGIFMSSLVVANYALVLLVFPSFVVLHDRMVTARHAANKHDHHDSHGHGRSDDACVCGVYEGTGGANLAPDTSPIAISEGQRSQPRAPCHGRSLSADIEAEWCINLSNASVDASVAVATSMGDVCTAAGCSRGDNLKGIFTFQELQEVGTDRAAGRAIESGNARGAWTTNVGVGAPDAAEGAAAEEASAWVPVSDIDIANASRVSDQGSEATAAATVGNHAVADDATVLATAVLRSAVADAAAVTRHESKGNDDETNDCTCMEDADITSESQPLLGPGTRAPAQACHAIVPSTVGSPTGTARSRLTIERATRHPRTRQYMRARAWLRQVSPEGFATFFGGWYCDYITRNCMRVVAVAGLAVLTAVVGAALSLRGPDRLFQIFRDGHNTNEYYRMEQAYDGTASLIRPRLIWGLTPSDRGRRDLPGSLGTLDVDPRFDMSGEDAQVFLLGLCKELASTEHGEEGPNERAARMLPGSLSCVHLDMDKWLKEAQRHADVWAAGGGGRTQELLLPRGLPVPSNVWPAALSAWVHSTHFKGGITPDGQMEATGVWFHNGSAAFDGAESLNGRAGSVAAFSIGFYTRTTIWQSYDHMEPQYDYWHAWLSERLARAPPSLRRGFLASEVGWSIMQTQRLFVRTAWTSMFASVALAFVTLFVATRDARVAACACVCIGGVVALFLGFMVCAKWRLNMIESVCMTILVGMAVDYVVHVASAYVRCPDEELRKAETEAEAAAAVCETFTSGTARNARARARAAYALSAMGPPIVGGFVTTVGASVFLWQCSIVMFVQFGVFVAVVRVRYACKLARPLLHVLALPKCSHRDCACHCDRR